MKSLFVFAVISDDIKAAGHRDQELMAFFQRMARAVGAARNVIEIKHAFNLKRDVPIAF